MMKGPLYDFVTPKRIRLIEDFETPYGTVPEGFVSDGASVPRPFRWLMTPFGDLVEGAILHDYLYVMAIESKEYADKAFRSMLFEFHVPKWKIKLAYLAVKYFGKGNY